MSFRVQSGLDRLVEEGFTRLKGLRVGLLAHPASVDGELRHALDLMIAAKVKPSTLFGPEHGVNGEAQDMEEVHTGSKVIEPRSGARLFSLYGPSEASLRPTPEQLEGLDLVVVDLQDVGARYYTFAATMGYLLEAAAEAKVRVLVLDRPNPLGGRAHDIEGPRLKTGFLSFVGSYDLAIRHGLTIGEYARLVSAEKKLDLELEVLPMRGYSREMDFEATGLPWVLPSPNMPTVDTAWIYPGQCLIEGTNLSEGRGTTRPFELCGAPYLDCRKLAELAGPKAGPGVTLRPLVFRPTFQKHAQKTCGGVQIHVTDRAAVRSVQVTLALIVSARKLAPNDFDWRRERYEYVTDRLAIDLLFGSEEPRLLVEAGASAEEITRSFAADEAEFRHRRVAHLLY